LHQYPFEAHFPLKRVRGEWFRAALRQIIEHACSLLLQAAHVMPCTNIIQMETKKELMDF
jgi:hypothetical protein